MRVVVSFTVDIRCLKCNIKWTWLHYKRIFQAILFVFVILSHDSPHPSFTKCPFKSAHFPRVNYPLVCHLSCFCPPDESKPANCPQFRPLCSDPPSNWGCPLCFAPQNEWTTPESSKEIERPHLSNCQIRAPSLDEKELILKSCLFYRERRHISPKVVAE